MSKWCLALVALVAKNVVDIEAPKFKSRSNDFSPASKPGIDPFLKKIPGATFDFNALTDNNIGRLVLVLAIGSSSRSRTQDVLFIRGQ